MAMCVPHRAPAIQPPDAGRILEGIRPAPQLPPAVDAVVPDPPPDRPALQLPADISVFVTQFRITGARVFTDSELLALLDGLPRELSLADLQGIADRITQHYRKSGYPLARAYIPAQAIENGVVEIRVLEGRLGRLVVDNRSLLADQPVAKHLSGLREGETIEATRLERTLLLLDELPGVEVRSTLKPGASVGLTELNVSLDPERRITGSVESDTFGDRYTGSLRAGAALNINSPAGLGDVLSLRTLSAGEGLSYGRVSYQAPLDVTGTKAGVAWSQTRYRLGEEFEDLDAHGEATTGTVYLLQPLLRSRRTHLDAQLTYEQKRLDDRLDAVSTETHRTLNLWSIGLSGDHADGFGGGGVVRYAASLVAGELELDATSAALDAEGLRSAGSYSKATYHLVRLQQLAGKLDARMQLSGQAAKKNLDSSEKFSLGGAYGVRAYPQGEAAADDAWLLNLELRYAPAPAWLLSAFYDTGSGDLSHAPTPGASGNTRRLSGAGLGVAWSGANDVWLQAFAAWRMADEPVAEKDRSPRLWLQAVKYF